MRGVGAGALQKLGLQLALEEGIGVADIDQQVGQPRAVLDQRHRVMRSPRRSVGTEIVGQRLFAPRHLARRDDRRECRDAAETAADGASATVSAPWPPIEWPVIPCRSGSIGKWSATSAGNSSVT